MWFLIFWKNHDGILTFLKNHDGILTFRDNPDGSRGDIDETDKINMRKLRGRTGTGR